MRMYRSTVLAVLSLSVAANAGVLSIDLDSTAASKFVGIGTSAAIYTDTVQVENTQSGLWENYDLVVNITGSGAITLNATGLGIVDSAVNDGETIDFAFTLSPSAGTMSGLASFEFTELGHGIATSNFPSNFVAVADGVRSNILADGVAGPADISNLEGMNLSITASGAPFGAGSVEGISSISFDATSVPEPTSLLLCSFCLVGVTLRRRRKPTTA